MQTAVCCIFMYLEKEMKKEHEKNKYLFDKHEHTHFSLVHVGLCIIYFHFLFLNGQYPSQEVEINIL